MIPHIDSAWLGQVRRTRRTDPIYKPALILVVLDLIEEGLATASLVPLDLALVRFDELLVRAGLAASRGADRGHMPAYHSSSSSSTEEPFWDLVRAGVAIGPQQEPSSNRVLLARADGLQLDETLANALTTPGDVDLARAAVYRLLEDYGRADCLALLHAHDVDAPLVKQAAEELTQQEAGPFQLDDPDAKKVRTVREQIVRDRSIRVSVLPPHDYACALCATRIVWSHLHEVEVAHIKPRALRGTDDPRNTLSLCQTHHWAFDLGLWSAEDDRRVLVRAANVARGDDLAALRGFAGKELRLPARASAAPHVDALHWHRVHRFARAA